ncbi:protein ENHANCED DISEASE RESISTANCE 2 [Euphorbia lathyris]|uniref:protein ENHANCED DISEASE RESISTANCE 2 n=1 Tax=Euphorbia lathyris TaxID=212925 RepID=UPI003313A7B3
MANLGDGPEGEWIESIKSEGAVPFLELDDCSNGWASPPGEKFMVRGPDYFTTKVKVPANEYILKPLGFDWIKSSTKIGDVLRDPNSRVRKAMDHEFPSGDKPFVWAFNLQVPSKDNYSAVAYFVAKEPIPKGSLMDQFLNADDGFRNSRLKLIANIVKGPWIVRKAVGEQAVCVIGRSLTCNYCIAENYFELDVDIGSSVVASAIVHLAFGYITKLTVDIAFLIEGQTESELPEQILGAVRFSELDLASAQLYEPSPESLGALQSKLSKQTSLSKRLWKTLGQGFSQLLKPIPQESSSTDGSPRANGTSTLESCNEDTKK